MECYNCHKLGHFQSECPSKEMEANFIETQEEMLLMSYLDMNNGNIKDVWFFDSDVAIICVGRRNTSQILMKVLEIL